MTEQKKNSILVVDDENTNILALTHILSPYFTVYAAKSGIDAVAATEKFMPDIILLDIVMPEMNGYAVINTLKKSEKTCDIPVIFITGLNDAESEEMGLVLGAADYISKPFSAAIVKLRVNNQIKMINQMRIIEELSVMDQLTTIPNRRGFDKRINMEWARAIRDKTSLSVLIIDIDMFKVYNDTYGHQQGDIALCKVAAMLTQSINRSTDFTARWGGEEFIVLLPNTDMNGAINIAEIIRLNVSNMMIPFANGTETRVTISVGVKTQSPWQDRLLDRFIADADKALYIAKELGRNQVCYSTD